MSSKIQTILHNPIQKYLNLSLILLLLAPSILSSNNTTTTTKNPTTPKIGEYGYPEVDGILILNDTNIDEAINKFPYILVKFYAPWCGVTKDKYPKFVELADRLRNELDTPVPVAKIDAYNNKKAHQKYVINRYPSFQFFINGELDYNADLFRVNQTYGYLSRKLGPVSEPITDEDDLQNARVYHKLFVLYSGELNHTDYKAYKRAATEMTDIHFYHTTYRSKT